MTELNFSDTCHLIYALVKVALRGNLVALDYLTNIVLDALTQSSVAVFFLMDAGTVKK